MGSGVRKGDTLQIPILQTLYAKGALLVKIFQ